MEEILEKAQPIIEMLSQSLMALVVLATVLAKVVAGGKHAKDVSGFAMKLLAVIHKLPTFGLNPRTKHLEEQLEAMKKDASE